MSIKNRFKKWLAKVLKNELLQYIPNIPSEIPPIRITEKEFQILRAEYRYMPYSLDSMDKEFLRQRLKEDLFKETEKYIEYKWSNPPYQENIISLELVVAIPKKTH